MSNNTDLYITLDSKLEYVKQIEDSMEPEDRIIVLKFLMYFNIFENTFFEDNGKKVYKKLELLNIVLNKEHWLDIKKFNFFAEHFANRFDEQSTGSARRYDGLKFHPNDKNHLLPALKAVFTQGEYDNKLLYYYLTIAYKYRNNLFHGEKAVEDLRQYREEFECINEFLSQLMKETYNNNFSCEC